MTIREIQDFVFNFLSNKGLPLITVASIMGNITAESGWDVDAIENGSGAGFGLCQWTDTQYSDRRSQLERYGTDLQSQCEFLWSELTGENTNVTGASYQWIANPADSVDNGEGFSFSNADFLAGNGSIEVLTKAFCYCWERPAYATNHLTSTRIPAAKEFYERYSGVTPDPDPDIPDPDNPDAPTWSRKKSGYNFVLFNQRNRRLKRG